MGDAGGAGGEGCLRGAGGPFAGTPTVDWGACRGENRRVAPKGVSANTGRGRVGYGAAGAVATPRPPGGASAAPRRGLGPPWFNGGPRPAAPAPPSPPCWGLLRKWMGEGDLEGTQPCFPSGATPRRPPASAVRRAGRRRVRAEGLGGTRAVAGAGKGCRPRSAPPPQVGAAVWVPGLDGSRATGTERRGLQGCARRCAPAGRWLLVGSWGIDVGPLGRSLPPSSRGASPFLGGDAAARGGAGLSSRGG